jgi:penicillin-binding protein 1A
VLKNMVAAGYLSPAQADRAARTGKAGLARVRRKGVGRYFVDWVLGQVGEYVSTRDKDLVVTTTLDTRRQTRAEQAVRRALDGPGAKAGVGQAAVVVMEADGAVRAMVGGRDYTKSQFNRAVQARRQPGSAFKPFVYLAGLRAGLTPETVMTDEEIEIDGWRPDNFDGRHVGRITLADAFARSINTVAVKVSEKAGRERVIATARRFGIGATLRPHPSLALGAFEVSPLELAAAYVPFANGGTGVWAYGIEEIRDGAGTVLYRRSGSGPGRVAPADAVGAVHAMMRAVVREGTARRAGLPQGTAGKTGTSQDFRDAWFAGSVNGLTAVVWMGNDDGRGMKHVTGGGLPARTWARVMGHVPKPAPAPAPAQRPAPKPAPEPGFMARLFEMFRAD